MKCTQQALVAGKPVRAGEEIQRRVGGGGAAAWGKTRPCLLQTLVACSRLVVFVCPPCKARHAKPRGRGRNQTTPAEQNKKLKAVRGNKRRQTGRAHEHTLGSFQKVPHPSHLVSATCTVCMPHSAWSSRGWPGVGAWVVTESSTPQRERGRGGATGTPHTAYKSVSTAFNSPLSPAPMLSWQAGACGSKVRDRQARLGLSMQKRWPCACIKHATWTLHLSSDAGKARGALAHMKVHVGRTRVDITAITFGQS